MECELSSPAPLVPLELIVHQQTNPLPPHVEIGSFVKPQLPEEATEGGPEYIPRDAEISAGMFVGEAGEAFALGGASLPDRESFRVTFPEGTLAVRILGGQPTTVVMLPNGEFVRLETQQPNSEFAAPPQPRKQAPINLLEKDLVSLGELTEGKDGAWIVKLRMGGTLTLQLDGLPPENPVSAAMRNLTELQAKDPNSYVHSWTFTPLARAAMTIAEGKSPDIIDFSRQAFDCMVPKWIELPKLSCTLSTTENHFHHGGVEFPKGSKGIKVHIKNLEPNQALYVVMTADERFYVLVVEPGPARPAPLPEAISTGLGYRRRFSMKSPCVVDDITSVVRAAMSLDAVR